ncbi:MAG: clostripain-related cysteine peptidase [Rikenellaceae bacterium]
MIQQFPICRPLPIYFCWLLSLSLLLTACEKDLTSLPCVAADRTLVVYLAGDNNLSAESFQKLDAMTSAVAESPLLASSKAQVVVYHDPATASGAAPSLWRLTHDSLKPQLIETYPSENSASPEVLTRVIERVKTIAPAKSYALWIFSHASGWLPAGALSAPKSRSIVVDGKSEMEIAELSRAIPDNQFDIILFEACFMASVEVAWELRSKTRYIMASSAEMLSPGLTKLYAQTLPLLFDPASQTNPLPALTAIAKTYFNHQNAMVAADRSATVSIIDTQNLAPLAHIASQIVASASLLPSELLPDIATMQHFDRLSSHIFFDFGQYIAAIASPPQRVQLQDAISSAVPYAAATPQFMIGTNNLNGFNIHHHSGLTTYIPQPQFPSLNTSHRTTSWHKAIHK